MLKNSVKITYAEPWLPIHHRLFIEVVETCSARFALKKRYDKYTKNVQNKFGNECWDLAIDTLGIKFPKFNLPKRNQNRGLIIAANHPYGVTDGVILSWLASRYDPNFRVIAHGILQKEPSLATNILPIDFSNNKDAMRNNVLIRKEAINILNRNGIIAIFPAGSVAWSRKRGAPIQEEYWKPMVGKLLNSSNSDILLLKFEGSNSNLFQFASRIHQTMKQSLYLYEIKKSLDKYINIKICDFIKNETLPKSNDADLSIFLQKKIENFNH